MNRQQHDVTEAELALLQSLWDAGPATIRQLVDRVYKQGGASVYATVQKLLDRLESKGFVAAGPGGPGARVPGGGRPRRADRPAAAGRGRFALRRVALAAALAPGRGSGAFRGRAPRAARLDREARSQTALALERSHERALLVASRSGTIDFHLLCVSVERGPAVETLLHAGLSNAVSATFLALLVACLGRFLARRPAVLHCLWLLVLLKLVTPPLYEVPIPWPESLSSSEESRRPPNLTG